MKNKFIIQDYSEKDNLLLKVLKDSNLSFDLIKYEDINSYLINNKQLRNNYIFGCIDFCRKFVDCGVKIDWFGLKYEDFTASNTECLFRDIYLNVDMMIVSYSYLIQSKWDLYQIFAKDAKIFIRPNSIYKPFPGGLVDIQDFEKYIVIEADFKPHILKEYVCVASPKEIRAEWRFVCARNKIITSSLYRYQGLNSFVRGNPPKAAEIVNKVLASNAILPYMFIVDVCLLENGEYKLVELNPINSAGLYSCDRQLIVKEILEYDDSSTKNKASF